MAIKEVLAETWRVTNITLGRDIVFKRGVTRSSLSWLLMVGPCDILPIVRVEDDAWYVRWQSWSLAAEMRVYHKPSESDYRWKAQFFKPVEPHGIYRVAKNTRRSMTLLDYACWYNQKEIWLC